MKKLKSIIKTSAATAGLLFCINKSIETSVATLSNTKVNGKYFHWKNGNIFYNVCGQGKPLLLIHDLSVFSSGFEWSQIRDSLARNHTVYIIDLIGCGKSDKPLITYTNYYYIQLIRDFINNVIGEKTDVIVNGLSSSFVLLANLQYENLFNNIIMLNPKQISELKKTPSRSSKLLMDIFKIPFLGKSLYYLLSNRGNTEYYFTEKYFYNPFKLKPSVIKSAYQSSHSGKGNERMLLASLMGNYLNMDISKAVSEAKNLLILITGEKAANKTDIEKSYLKLNKNIIPFTVQEAKYYPQLENPEALFQILTIFS